MTTFESFVIFKEYKTFAHATPGHTLQIVCYYLGFVGFNFFGYSIIPFFVKWYGATLLNISNLTTIIWSMLSDILLFHRPFVSPPPTHDAQLYPIVPPVPPRVPSRDDGHSDLQPEAAVQTRHILPNSIRKPAKSSAEPISPNGRVGASEGGSCKLHEIERLTLI